MSNITENNRQLVPFLRDLADSIESDKLSPKQLQLIGEFFMSYKLSEEKDIQTEEDNFDSTDVTKFITLGWYIYRILLSEHNQETNSEKIHIDDL